MKFLALVILASIPFVLTQAVQSIQRRQPSDAPAHKLSIRGHKKPSTTKKLQDNSPDDNGYPHPNPETYKEFCLSDKPEPWETSVISKLEFPDGTDPKEYILLNQTLAGCVMK